jgi:virginiamycin B lyase
MRTSSFSLAALTSLFAILIYAGLTFGQEAAKDSSAALTGQVTSTPEGPMEGVLVSAKRDDSTVTVTVVSDAQGHYTFPQKRLEPGDYSLKIRAIGYELDDSRPVQITPHKTATADLKLHRVQDISAQLTNAEWLTSVPGPDDLKAALLNCVVCHTLERIVRSKHDAAEWVKVQQRMLTYTNSSFPLHPQKRPAPWLLQPRGEQLAKAQQRLAEFLSTVNLSSVPRWEYALKTLPRPTGRGTRMIVTEYDLPRKAIEPHDVIVDSQGMAWYSSFGEQAIGKLDPKTGKVTEYPVPITKEGWPTGTLALRFDKDQNMWIGLMLQGAIAKFDRKTEEFQTWKLPPEWNNDATQVNMVSPERYSVDGKVWLENHGYTMILRMDLKSGKFEPFEPFKGAFEKGENHNIYDVVPDSQNNAYFTDFEQGQIGRIDAKTGKITFYPTPTPYSRPRRAWMDAQDRFWFAEYRVNRMGMFDTRTERFREWEEPNPWSSPYDLVMDNTGQVWIGGVTNDRVLRLNPETGESVEYLLPRSTNIRRVFVDNSTTPATFWVGSNHGASILKLEQLN